MALIQADRVKELSTTTGSANFTLGGASLGFTSFSAGVGSSNTCYYAASDGSAFEVGLGTVSANVLERTTVFSSSHTSASTVHRVDFQAGSKEVFATYVAEKAVILDAAGDLNITGEFNFATASTTGNFNFVTANSTGNLGVVGNASVGGTFHIQGNTSAQGTLNVKGAVSVSSTLGVEGEINNEVGNIVIDPTTQIVEIKGGGSTDAELKLNCRSNSHGQTIKSQEHSAGVTNTMLLPKGANSTLVSEVGTATLTNKTLDAAVSVSAAGVVNVGTDLSVLGNAEVGGTFKITSTVSAEAALNVGGLLNVTGSAGLAGNVNLGNATADSIVVGGVLTANASANLTGNVGVGGTITGGSTVSDQDGDLRDIPLSTKVSGNYTLAIGDAGNQVTINSANVIITVPTSVFAVGDIVSIISVNGCTASLACTAVNAVKAGDLAATALHTLDANGVASIMFSYTANLAVLTGNIS